MGGKSSSPKQRVADYLLSIHFGVCHLADSIDRIRVNDKTIFSGRQSGNGTLNINLPELFGGNKKEGGCRGLVEVLLGGNEQVLPGRLLTKLGGDATTVPGFRGITSLFFSGGGPEGAAGFNWTSNTAYLRPVDVTVRRTPKGFYPEKAMVPETPGSFSAIDRDFLSSDGPSWGAWNRVKSVRSSGFVLESGSEERLYDLQGNYLDNLGLTYQPTPPVSTVVLPPASPGSSVGFSFAGFAGNSIIAGRLTDLPASSAISLCTVGSGASSPGIVGGTIGIDLTANLPADQRFMAVAMSQSSALLMVIMRVGTAPVLALGPRRWYLIDLEGQVLDQGDVLEDGGAHEFGLGDWARDSYRACSLEPNGRFLWTAYGAGGEVSWYGINNANQLVRMGNLPTGIIEAPSFNRPGICATESGAYVTAGDFRAVFQRSKTTYEHANANPAHIIFECLTNNDWGLGLPPNQLDLASFASAADILYDEAMGLSLLWSSATDMESFIGQILSHIDGSCGVDPSTGKIYLSLVRGGYDLDGLFELTEDNCTITRMQRKALSETFNEVVVTWTNPENEQEETVTVHDLANYAAQGVLNSSSSNYYGVRSAALALRLALRDLTRGAAPLASFEADADRSLWKAKPGDVVKLSYAEYGLAGLPVRVVAVDYGKPGSSKVKLSLVEDVFETPNGAYVDAPGAANPSDEVTAPNPLKFIQTGAVPYYLVSSELGSAEASAVATSEAYNLVLGGPNGIIQFIAMHTPVVDALGNTSYQYQNTLEVPGRAVLSTPLIPEITSTAVGFSGLIGNGAPVAGSLVWLGTTPAMSELCVVQSVEGTLTLRRGVLDTTPKNWIAGTPMWFITPGQELYDPTIRLVGQAANYKLLPVNQVGTFLQDWAQVTTITPDDRQHRPYRPANVTINGEYWPVVSGSPFVVNWSRRNRLLEEPTVRLWNAADVTPEVGTAYSATLTRVDTGAVLATATGLTGTTTTLTSSYSGTVRLVVKSTRDGLDSYQSFDHVFSTVATVDRITEDGETRITEDGETRILES